jgi:hypothetical protein
MTRAPAIRDHFLGWQCRLRQIAVRDHGGRPSLGMTPRLEIDTAEVVADRIVTLIVEKDAERTTDQLRHICRQTQDPRSRYERALALLGTGYFQFPGSFSDSLTALFRSDGPTVVALVRRAQCVLEFEQFSQRFRLPCAVSRLTEDAAAYRATFWHNTLFNPLTAPHSPVLSFEPDWDRAVADPDSPI